MRDLECKLSVFWWAMYRWKENSCTHRVKRGRGQGLGNESVENKVRPELPLSAGHTPPPEKNLCHQRHVSKGVFINISISWVKQNKKENEQGPLGDKERHFCIQSFNFNSHIPKAQ